MKKITIILFFIIVSIFNCPADDEVKSYKVKEDEFDIQHSYYFKTFVVNNTKQKFELSIQEDRNGYGEVKIGNNKFKSLPQEITQTELIWRKGWAVQREINMPVLKLNEEHPRCETALGEAKLTPEKNRSAKDAVEMVFHKKEISYDNLDVKVQFEVSGNSDVLFIIINPKNSSESDSKFI